MYIKDHRIFLTAFFYYDPLLRKKWDAPAYARCLRYIVNMPDYMGCLFKKSSQEKVARKKKCVY